MQALVHALPVRACQGIVSHTVRLTDKDVVKLGRVGHTGASQRFFGLLPNGTKLTRSLWRPLPT